MIIKVISPLSVAVGKKKYYLNLNSYRNWHYQVNNNVKKAYKAVMLEQLQDLRLKKIDIEYQLFYGDKRKRDKGNITSVIQKFFLDALVETGCIVDDNDSFVGVETLCEPIYDKGKPRCEITITPRSL